MTDTRWIIHVDMDAFYASVEVLDDPSLAGKPVIVGGDPKSRGVVSAASYEARKFGVHSAMPMATAVRLCPQCIIMPVRMSRYVELSEKIHVIFQRYTPLIEPISIDEAFLEVTGVPRSPIDIGKCIKADIKNELKLTASVGIAPNKFLAKVASDLQKPDGFVVITDEDKQAVLDPLPVSTIYGVGKVTNKLLESHGIKTIAQLRQISIETLRTIVGNFADELLALAHGIDDRPVETPGDPKSVSSEHTFPADVADSQKLLAVLLEQVQEVASRLREHDLYARTIHLKFRYGNFKTITRAKTLDNPTSSTETLWQAAQSVFNTWSKAQHGALRLLGFTASNLGHSQQQQLSFFDNPADKKHKNLDLAIDKIIKRFGKDSIKRKL